MNKNENENENLLWKQLDSKCICSTRVVQVNEVKSLSPQQTEGNYIVMDAPSWVIVIPELQDAEGKEKFVMVEQWRHGSCSISREFPGGVVNEGEDPEAGAKRELLEETGYEARKITFLGKVSPNPAIMSNYLYVYAAEDLVNTHEQHLDADEYVRVFEEDAEEVFKKMGDAPYSHGLMVAAFQLFQRYKKYGR